MKKGIITILVGMHLFSCILIVSANANDRVNGSVIPGQINPNMAGTSQGGPTTVTVTEKIPGMDCGENIGDKDDVEHKKYKCTIQPGFGSVMLILRGLIKYATFITALIGVLMLVVSGVQYSIAGADKDAAGHAKTRIMKVLSGIVLLFLVGFILNSVAPWVYR